jgi:hypothetical protein
MDDNEWLAGRLERHRPHLRAVAYRMLGSLTEADDAVQGRVAAPVPVGAPTTSRTSADG